MGHFADVRKDPYRSLKISLEIATKIEKCAELVHMTPNRFAEVLLGQCTEALGKNPEQRTVPSLFRLVDEA